MTDRELLDGDGENQAVRCFLMLYGGTKSPTTGRMRDHLTMSGFEGCWPDWVGEAHSDEHLTKGGAQNWLRYLFGLEQAASAAPAQEPKYDEAEFKRMVERGTKAWADTPNNWLEELRGNDMAECSCHKCHGNKPRTMMVLCPTCGNKRCPHASDHTLACTGSNEPGQPGSIYPA